MSKNNDIPDKMSAKEFQSLMGNGTLDFSGTKGKIKDSPKITFEDLVKDQDRIFKVGIDPGVETGFAVFEPKEKKFHSLKTVTIIEAMEGLKVIKGMIISVTVEDARMVRYFKDKDKKAAESKAQGAGSVKRDCKIWEEFLIYHNIPHKFVRPNNKMTKLSSEMFKKITKHEGRASNHARDAGMLIYNS